MQLTPMNVIDYGQYGKQYTQETYIETVEYEYDDKGRIIKEKRTKTTTPQPRPYTPQPRTSWPYEVYYYTSNSNQL